VLDCSRESEILSSFTLVAAISAAIPLNMCDRAEIDVTADFSMFYGFKKVLPFNYNKGKAFEIASVADVYLPINAKGGFL